MSTRIESRLRGLARLAALAAASIALVAGVGWLCDLPRLRGFLAGAIGMRPNAIVTVLLLATALLLSGESTTPWRRQLARGAAGLVVMLAALTLAEHILGWDAGIDALLFRRTLGQLGSHPGRMAPAAAFDCLLLGIALLLAGNRTAWVRQTAQGSALVAGTASLLSLLGYTFHVAGLYTLSPYAAQSLPSALACFLLSLAVLLTWPERGWVRVLASERAGGALLRLALPLMLGLTWVASWLSVAGARAGLYSLQVDQVLVALPLMVAFCAFFFWMAAVLNRAGEEQLAQQQELERLNRELEERVELRTAQLVESNRILQQEICERRKFEQELQEKQNYSRSLLEASLDPLVTIRKDGKITDVNRATEVATGMPRERLLGSDFCDYFTEPEKARQSYEQVFSCGRVQDYPLALRHGSGRITEVLYNASVYRNEAGEVEGVFAAARDITERKRAEEQVRRAALYSRSLLEASLDPMVTISKDGKIMDVNRATETATGVPRERLIGSDFSNYFTEPGRARQGYEQVFSQGLVQDYPLVMRRSSGQVMEVLYNATLFRNQAGEVEGVFAAARDVTARKRAEREAQRLTRALRALSECNEAMVRATDEGSLLQQVCQIAVEVGGYRMAWVGYAEQEENKTVRPAALAGAEEGYLGTVNITWADVERGRGPTGTAIRTGQTTVCQDTLSDPSFAPWREEARRRGFRSSIVLPLKNGEGVFGSLSIYAVEAHAFDAAEQHLLEDLASDLSYGIVALRARAEVRALNQELEERVRQRTAELEESNRELESFSYSVSHDLRAPLRHVDGFSKILLEEYGPQLDQAGRGYLERVRQGTQFMGRLVDDLLNLSRVGRQGLSLQITGLGSLLEEVRMGLRAELEGREVEWRIGELPFVECDPGLMRQVLANLLSNALKFTRPRPHAVIEVGQQPGDGAPVIFVRDNGVGFNMKYADKLFGIFQRLHRQEDFEGTGVGLATVERILHKHGGRVWAEAELDKGATFYFALGAAENSGARPAETVEVAA